MSTSPFPIEKPITSGLYILMISVTSCMEIINNTEKHNVYNDSLGKVVTFERSKFPPMLRNVVCYHAIVIFNSYMQF